MGVDLIWFGVLLGVNMQTSFMHPPFGFALFYLRSVAPSDDYDDRITSKRIAKVTTGQIYWGAVPFVVIQIVMVGLIIALPKLVSTGAGGGPAVDIDKAFQQMQKDSQRQDAEPPATTAPDGGASAPSESPAETSADKSTSDEEAMKRLLEAVPKKP